MRDTMTLGAWIGGALLMAVGLLVLCQHAEGERTRAALYQARLHVDNRIRTLDARLTDMQAEVNRKKLASATATPPLDPKRLAKASQELDQLIGTPPAAPESDYIAGPAGMTPPAPLPQTAAPAPAVDTTDMVRACPGGRFYHRPGCKRVQKRTVALSRARAQNKGLKRCPTCGP
jgi:hypothetical protein